MVGATEIGSLIDRDPAIRAGMGLTPQHALDK
jgi:hypothetical protein